MVLCCRVVEWVRQSGFAVDTAMVNTAMESVRLCGESLLCEGSLFVAWLSVTLLLASGTVEQAIHLYGEAVKLKTPLNTTTNQLLLQVQWRCRHVCHLVCGSFVVCQLRHRSVPRSPRLSVAACMSRWWELVSHWTLHGLQ